MEILLGNDWFKITYALLSDKRYKRAHKDLGIQSLGIIVFIWLKLRQEKDYRYEFNDLDLLADEANVSIPIFTTIINSYGLFTIVEINEIKYIESSVLNHWMSGYDKKVIQNKNAGQISAKKRKEDKEKRLKQLSLNNSTQHMLNTCNTEREEEIEVKEEENIKIKRLEFFDIDSKIDRDMILKLKSCETREQKISIDSKIDEFIDYCVDKQKRYKDYNLSFERYLEVARQRGWNF